MSSSVSDENLEKKFQGVTNTQDSIQTLSLWLLHHKAHHQKIVGAWMKVLQKAKMSHRLTLFYLANDVVQNGKRKGFVQFGNSFAEVLREATLLVRDSQIRPNIERVFRIWEERSVYTPEYIADLRAILTNAKVPATAPSKLLAEFKPENVIEKIRAIIKLEQEVSSKTSSINLNKLNAKKAEIVQQFKDRTHGQQFKKDFDDSLRNVEELIKVMNQEVKQRNELILLLEQSEIYYDSQRGEAKIVANAYKNFGVRVKTLQKKLEELTSTFASPIPSPCPDAPSPTTSEQELELNLPNDKMLTDETENLDNVPSPVGTPEGLNLSPEPKDVKSELQPVSTQNVGNPIPTLSNFFSHEQSGMTSWLDAFSNKKSLPENDETPKSDPSSLESRLSNLLQNIPNLPSGLQSTLFSNASPGNSTPLQETVNSPNLNKKDKLSESLSADFTPKDEYSGQNTPLQDEDTHSSHAFFTKLASSNKTHSPKDILKGLTNLIQSASAEKNDENSKKDMYSFEPSESYNQTDGMSSFIKNLVPSASQAPQLASSPSTYFSSPQPGFPAPVRTVSNTQTTTVNSYQSTMLHEVPVYSSNSASEQNQHMSFIPSIVPSTPLDAFNFVPHTYSTQEYNPEMEHFDTNVDIENAIDNSDIDVPSPEVEPSSPEIVGNEMPRSIGGRRLSTLITVVTKDSPDNSLPSNPPYSHEDLYKTDTDIRAQETPNWGDSSAMVSNSAPVVTQDVDTITNVSSPTEEFFIGKEGILPPFYTSVPPPPLPPDLTPVNGQSVKLSEPVQQMVTTPPPPNCPLSRIETVHSQRENMNGRWFGNNWGDSDMRGMGPPRAPPLPSNMRSPPPFFENRNVPPMNFRPRNNWMPRNHPNNFRPHHPYRPGPPNKRFPFRGRGWSRHQPRY